jgi:hypothetical protein
VIVRTADVDITADNVFDSLEDISKISTAAGGWVVSSFQSRKYEGQISIRVPAERFEDVMAQITDLAVEVERVTTSTQDFTEEFTDINARARTLRDTVEQLRVIFLRAEEVEDALVIQQEITRVQSDLEVLEARINFLSQSAAFSLISISIQSIPFEIAIDAGEDRTAAVNDALRYRAKFKLPEDIEEVEVTWKFGDGSRAISISETVPTSIDGEVITAPVTHRYGSDVDSPYIVTATLRGAGKAGVVIGEDKLITAISRLPVIELFMGQGGVVEYGTDVTLEASYSKPEGVTDLEYTWDFGDGTTPVTIEIDEDAESNRLTATHVYENFRSEPYRAKLRMSGKADVGDVVAVGEITNVVRESIGVGQTELQAGNITRDAGRVLNKIWVIAASAGLWFFYLSPVWIVLALIVYALRRWGGKLNPPSNARREVSKSDSESMEL